MGSSNAECTCYIHQTPSVWVCTTAGLSKSKERFAYSPSSGGPVGYEDGLAREGPPCPPGGAIGFGICHFVPLAPGAGLPPCMGSWSRPVPWRKPGSGLFGDCLLILEVALQTNCALAYSGMCMLLSRGSDTHRGGTTLASDSSDSNDSNKNWGQTDDDM